MKWEHYTTTCGPFLWLLAIFTVGISNLKSAQDFTCREAFQRAGIIPAVVAEAGGFGGRKLTGKGTLQPRATLAKIPSEISNLQFQILRPHLRESVKSADTPPPPEKKCLETFGDDSTF